MTVTERSIHDLQGRLQQLLSSEVLRNLSRYSLGTGAAQFLLMIYTLLVARFLGPNQFGLFTGSYALTSLSAFLVNWGMDTRLLREPGSLTAPRQWAGRVLRVKAGLGLLWAFALIIIPPLVRPEIFTPLFMFVCASDIWFDGALTTHISALNIQKRFHAVSRIIFFSRALRLLSAVGLVLVGNSNPLDFAITRCVTTFIGLAVAVWVLKPDLRAGRTPSGLRVWRLSVPYGLSDFLALIYMQADVSLLTLLAGSSAAGLYSPASGLVNALFVIPSTVFLISVPILSRQYINQPRRLPNSLKWLTFGFLGLGLLLTLFVGGTGGWILRVLLGPKYLLTSALLGLLSPLLFFKSLGFAWAAFLVAVGWQKQRLIPQAVSAAVNVLVNLWAIPRLGIPGVALVYVLTELILAIGYGLLVMKWLRERNE